MKHVIYIDGKKYGETENYMVCVRDMKGLMASGIANTRIRQLSFNGNMEIPETVED